MSTRSCIRYYEVDEYGNKDLFFTLYKHYDGCPDMMCEILQGIIDDDVYTTAHKDVGMQLIAALIPNPDIKFQPANHAPGDANECYLYDIILKGKELTLETYKIIGNDDQPLF